MADSALNRYIMQGTAAQRAAYTPSPATVAAGQALGIFFYETDTTRLYSWNSGTNAWVLITGQAADTEYGIPARLTPNTGSPLADNFFFGRAIICPRAGTLNSVKFYAFAAQASSKVTPAMYADSGTGTMGAISASGAQVTGVTQGLNKFTLTSGLAVTKGQIVWVGFQYLVNGGGTVSLALDTAAVDVAFYSGALQNPGPPTGVTYATRTWGTMWASSDT